MGAERVSVVGWINANSPYTRGSVSKEFLSKLLALIAASPTRSLSLIHCVVCEEDQAELKEQLKQSKSKIETARINAAIVAKCMPTAIYGRKVVELAKSDFEIRSPQGIIYLAPKIIYHYCTDHNYRPPDEFIQAVIDSYAEHASQGWLRRLKKWINRGYKMFGS